MVNLYQGSTALCSLLTANCSLLSALRHCEPNLVEHGNLLLIFEIAIAIDIAIETYRFKNQCNKKQTTDH